MAEFTNIFDSFNSKLANLEQVQRDIVDGYNFMGTQGGKGVIEVEYNKTLIKKYFPKSPFYSYLRMKGRETSTSSVEVGYRYKTMENHSSFIQEGADLPAYKAGAYDTYVQNVKELVYKFSVSDKAQAGINIVDLKAMEIEDGVADIAETMDKTLLTGKSKTGSAGSETDTFAFDGIDTLIEKAGSKEKHIHPVADSENGQVTHEDVDSLAQELIDMDSNPSVMVTTPAVTRRLKELEYAQLRKYNTQNLALGYNALTYLLPNGNSVPILIDQHLTPTDSSVNHDLYLLDENSLYIKTLAENAIIPLAKTKLTEDYVIRKMTTFFCDAIFKNGKLTGINPEAPK